MSSSSQEPSAPGKPAALFSWGSENPGINSRVLFSNTLTRQNLEDLFFKATKVVCSVKQNLNLWNKNIKLDLSIFASVRNNNKLMLKDWNYKMLNTDKLNLDESKFVYKKNYLWRKRFSEILKSDACTKWKKWRAQELRVDEVSVQRVRENHETIQKAHISVAGDAKTFEFYEWFGRMTRSGIKSQWEIVLRSQSACNGSEFSFHAEPPQTLASWHMEYIGITGKRFW